MSDSSIEEEDADISDDPGASKHSRTEPPFLSTRPRTESFDKMVSDELMIALAMMRVNSLSSLDEKQKERVTKLREKINVGDSGNNGTKHQKTKKPVGKDFEVAGWSSAPNPSEKAVLPLGITHEILSCRTDQNGRETLEGLSAVKAKKTAAEPSIGSSQSDMRSHEECGSPVVKSRMNRLAKEERMSSPLEILRNHPTPPVAATKASPQRKIAHKAPMEGVTRNSTNEFPSAHHTTPGNKVGWMNNPEQGEYNGQEDTNQLEECSLTMAPHTPSEEEEEEEKGLQSESNFSQKDPLLQAGESQSTEAGNSSIQGKQGSSIQDNTEQSGSSIEKKSNENNSSTCHKKRKSENSGGLKNSKTRTKRLLPVNILLLLH